MCGNGIRCLFQFIAKLGFPKQKYIIETMQDVIPGFFHGEDITIHMSSPVDMQCRNISLSKHSIPVHFLNTGVPHAVIFVEEIDKVDLPTFGPLIRHHPSLPQMVLMLIGHLFLIREFG